MELPEDVPLVELPEDVPLVELPEDVPLVEEFMYPAFTRMPGGVSVAPRRAAAETEIIVPSVENTELKTWSRSEYSHACYAYFY